MLYYIYGFIFGKARGPVKQPKVVVCLAKIFIFSCSPFRVSDIHFVNSLSFTNKQLGNCFSLDGFMIGTDALRVTKQVFEFITYSGQQLLENG